MCHALSRLAFSVHIASAGIASAGIVSAGIVSAGIVSAKRFALGNRVGTNSSTASVAVHHSRPVMPRG
jgi:hypothetical protein